MVLWKLSKRGCSELYNLRMILWPVNVRLTIKGYLVRWLVMIDFSWLYEEDRGQMDSKISRV